MPLTVVAPALRRPLTTVQRVIEEGIPGMGDITSQMVGVMIDRATAAIETALGYQLARERVRETVTSDAARIWLSRRPLVELHEVVTDGTALVSGSYLAPDDRSVVIPSYRNWIDETLDDWTEWSHWPNGLARGNPARVWRKVEVEYTAGYVVHGWPTSDPVTLPADIEWACMMLVRMQVEQRSRPAGVRSERLGDAAWTYGEPGKAAIPDEVMARLVPYRAAVL